MKKPTKSFRHAGDCLNALRFEIRKASRKDLEQQVFENLKEHWLSEYFEPEAEQVPVVFKQEEKHED